MAASAAPAENSPSPVFLLMKDLPNHNGEWYSTAEVCRAAEHVTGYGSVYGAQKYHGTWRIYPTNIETRQKLLFQGFEIRGVMVQPYDKNPTLFRDKNNVRIPTTRLTVGGIPLSHTNDDILGRLNQIGVNVLSEVIMEKDRDKNRKLTRFYTGNRILYIEIPKQPLPKTLQIASYRVSLFHREQKTQGVAVSCTRCLRDDHHVSQCEAPDFVCRTCNVSGHRSGDPRCEGFPPMTQRDLPLPPTSILTPLDISYQFPPPPPPPASTLTLPNDADKTTEAQTSETTEGQPGSQASAAAPPPPSSSPSSPPSSHTLPQADKTAETQTVDETATGQTGTLVIATSDPLNDPSDQSGESSKEPTTARPGRIQTKLTFKRAEDRSRSSSRKRPLTSPEPDSENKKAATEQRDQPTLDADSVT